MALSQKRELNVVFVVVLNKVRDCPERNSLLFVYKKKLSQRNTPTMMLKQFFLFFIIKFLSCKY